jgi:hypothetical protein
MESIWNRYGKEFPLVFHIYFCSFKKEKIIDVFNHIIKEVFAKAEEETGFKAITTLANHISEELLEDYKFQLNPKSLRNYHKAMTTNEDVGMSMKVVNALCQYLGYKNLKDYNSKQPKQSSKLVISKEKGLLGILIVAASYFGIDSFQKKCMVWVENSHYEKIKCEEANAVPIETDLLLKFKRIDPDCNYPFFNLNGTANLWYGKSINGEYEYFSYLAGHPITGKTLKEITPYMIKEHICPTYSIK